MDEESALGFLKSLRAHRHFAVDRVSDHDVGRMLEAARWTGSARNRQPWRLVIVRSDEVRRELSNLGLYAQHVALAPLAVAIATDDESGGRDTAFDAGRLCQNLALAAHGLGLASCPVTLHPEENTERAARLLRLGPPWRVEHVLVIGHPVDPPPGNSAVERGRRPMEEIAWEV